MTDRTFDRGRQPERTDLAWQRTVLVVAIGSLISLRLLPPVLGSWGFLIGATGLAAALSWFLARQRAQHVAATLTATAPPPGAGLLVLIAVTTAASAGVGLLYTILLALQRL